MQRLLSVLAGLLLAAAARGQFEEINDVIYEINDPPTVAATHTILSATHSDAVVGTAVLGDFIYFSASGWTRLGKPADGTYSVLFASGVPSWTAAGGSGAPTDAPYWTSAAVAGLSAEVSLAGFTGLVLNTAGTPTSKAANTCTNQFARSDTASGVWTCASIVNADITASTIDLTTKVTGTLPVGNGGTGITSLGTGVATWLGTPSSANLAAAVSDETGSGLAVFNNAPSFIGPIVGNGATGPGYVDFKEDTDNGTNRARLIGPASTADVDITLPATTGTVLLSTTTKFIKSISIETPTSSENIAIFYTSQAATITKVRAVVKGSSPSVTYNTGYGTSIASLTSVTTSPSAVTNVTTGVDATLNNTAIPADGYLVLTTSAQSGTVTWINVTVEYTIP